MGVGVFGRNHARIYKELELQGEAVRLLGVVDPDLGRADAVAREFGCKAFGSVQQIVDHAQRACKPRRWPLLRCIIFPWRAI